MRKIKKFRYNLIAELVIQIFFVLVILNIFSSTANASCGNLCNKDWWGKSSLLEIKLEFTNSKNLNARDDFGFRPLHFAVQNGDKDKLQLLLLEGVDTNAKTDYGFTPLYFAVGTEGDKEIVKMLINSGAIVNINNKNGITPLHYAAWGTAEKINMLIKAGADISAETNSGKTAFDLAKDNERLIDTETYLLLKIKNK